MSKRVTIMVDTDLDKKLRNKQARLILQYGTNFSYSKVINDTVRKGFK